MSKQELSRAGFQPVTKEAFWSWVMGTSRNVHPSPRGSSKDPEGFVSLWYDLRTGELLGTSADKSDKYYLRSDIA